MARKGYTYFMSNSTRTTLYIGVTNDIHRRTFEHKTEKNDGFTKRYKLHYLMYYEEFPSIVQAIKREKQLKNWHREWKWNLIKENNPELKDLAEGWYDGSPRADADSPHADADPETSSG